MERQRDESLQPEGDSELQGPWKPYVSPEIQEWGSILDLTLGGIKGGANDFPKKGGSTPS